MKTMRFTDGAGTDIFVTVPWGDHSGNIPPPTITFWRGADWTFAYAGDAEHPAPADPAPRTDSEEAP
jgi:hypothetical protein